MYAADMIQRKAARLRLHPTPAQAAQLAQITAACRFVYNLGLEQRRDWYRLGHKFTFASRCRELTLLSAQEDWLRAVPVHPLQQALRDLERAYRNWREGRARAPTPRGKSINDSFRCPDPISLEVERTSKSSGRIKLPKLTLRERNWRELPGKICNVTISRRVGQWFAAVQCEREMPDPARCALSAVGIDMGIAAFATLGDGTRIAPASHGSCNRRKAIRGVAYLQQRVANARKDFLHKRTTTSHGAVVVEALPVRSMTASAKGRADAPGRSVRRAA
jgi:putative transposase